MLTPRALRLIGATSNLDDGFHAASAAPVPFGILGGMGGLVKGPMGANCAATPAATRHGQIM